MYADTILRQALKRAQDQFNSLTQVLDQVKTAQETVERLEDNEIVLDHSVPDFDFAERDLNSKLSDMQALIDPLSELVQKQEKIDDEFAAACDGLIQKLLTVLKEKNFKVSQEKMGLALIKAMNIFRRRIALEDRIKRGEQLSEEEVKEMQAPDIRKKCILELFKAIDA